MGLCTSCMGESDSKKGGCGWTMKNGCGKNPKTEARVYVMIDPVEIPGSSTTGVRLALDNKNHILRYEDAVKLATTILETATHGRHISFNLETQMKAFRKI